MGELNSLYGKSHSEETKDIIRQKALGRKHSEQTKLLMSTKHGNAVHIYEKASSEGFELIGSFVSTYFFFESMNYGFCMKNRRRKKIKNRFFFYRNSK